MALELRLNGPLVDALVKAKGGVSAFLDAWLANATDGDDSLDRATVYRWKNGQFPKNPQTFMRLAGTLDVDPFALLTIPDGNVAAAAEALLEVVQNDRGDPAPLQLARSFLGRREEWPPAFIAAFYFGRRWTTHEFVHDPNVRSNHYQAVELFGVQQCDTLRPQVFHFAFQSPRRFAGRWLQYGFIQRHGPRAQLWHIDGQYQQLEIPEQDAPTRVETWFGPGPAIFRVASLHHFDLEVASGTTAPALRFNG